MRKYTRVFVYLRFSSEGQAKGHSFDRQRADALKFLRKHGIDESQVEWVEDPAFSAFTGDHLKHGALGKLLQRVRNGEESGGLLIFEAVDRASREGGIALITMLSEFLDAKFSIYFLDEPQNKPYNKKNPPPFAATFLSMRADLARLESQRKSTFSLSNWDKRRELARTTGQPLTRECPMWLVVENNEYLVIPEIAESIREVFRLARDGWGTTRIASYANREGLPAPANKGVWHAGLIDQLFKNRALIGECWPKTIAEDENGDLVSIKPIIGLYPAIIEPDLFNNVSVARSALERFPNRRDENNYNYLQGIGRCACGERSSWRRLNKNSRKQAGYSQYSCSERQKGASNCSNIEGKVFDSNFIEMACEKIPALILVADDKRAEKMALAGAELDEIERERGTLSAFLKKNPDLADEIADEMRANRDRRIRVRAELAELEELAAGKPFDFGDAVGAYLPAFLDYHGEKESTAGKTAFNARALFRARLIQSVKSVVIAIDRKSMRVVLKNGGEFEHPITDREFGTENDFTDAERAEMRLEQNIAQERLLRK